MRITILAGLLLVLAIGGNAIAADVVRPEPITAQQFEERARPVFFGEGELYANAFFLSGDALGAAEGDQYYGFGGGIRLGTNFAGNWLLQGDLFAETTSVESGTDDSYNNSFIGTGHVAYRNDQWLLGTFGGGLRTKQDNDATDTSERWFVGGEGQYYIGDRATLYAQGGYLGGTGGDDDLGEDSITEAWFARLVGRYFFTPSTRGDVSFAYADGIMDNDLDDAGIYTLGAAMEHQFTPNGFSGFVRYEFSVYEQRGLGDNDNLDEHVIFAGIKLRFGANSSLLDADRNGATLDTAPLDRWVAQTGGPLE